MNALFVLQDAKQTERSTSGIHARPLSKARCCRPKKFGRLPEGLLAPPSLCTTFLPPIVKGEVLSPKKIRATTGGIVTPPIATSPTLPKPHYPSKTTNTLASLVKGRWIDGKAQTVALLRLNCDTPALFITKPFCRQDGGIVTLTLALHQPFPNPHYPTRFSCCEFDSLTSHKNKIRPRFHGGELISISLSGVWGVAPSRVRATAPLTAKIKSAPVFTGANSSSH